MKKITTLVLALIFISCGASKSGSELPSKKTLKGTWEIYDIDFLGAPGIYKAFLFDTSDSACFKGSEWVFIPNNATGRFTTNASNSTCEVSNTRIIWSFFDDNETRYLQFKLVDEKNKPLAGKKTGYRSKIESLSESNMSVVVPSVYNGEAFDVVLKFSKKSTDLTL